MIIEFEDEILPRLKNLTNKQYSKDVAKLLGIAPTRLSTCTTKNNIPYKEIVEWCIKNNESLDVVFGNSVK